MKILNLFLSLGILILMFSACDKENPDDNELDKNFALTLEPKFDGNNFEFGKNYTNHLGQTIMFETFKFYISNIKLTNTDNSTVNISDVALFDLENDDAIEQLIPAGTYTSISFGIGLDSLTNHESDPNTFEVNHPLSYAQNTHWDWASLYKFMQIEGRVDEVASDFLQKTFSYHTGFDALYRPVTIEHSFEITEDIKSNITLQLNIEEVFNAVSSVDMINENTSHSLTPIATKLSDNISQSFNVKQD